MKQVQCLGAEDLQSTQSLPPDRGEREVSLLGNPRYTKKTRGPPDRGSSMQLYVGDTRNGYALGFRAAMEHIGLAAMIADNSKVFVKPNFTFPRHIPGVTTTPALLQEILRQLSETGAEVFVGESNGGYGSFTAEQAFAGHGLREICRETKTNLVNLSSIESEIYTRTVAGRQTSVRLPCFLVKDITLTVSVPVLKVHAMTTVSLSVKNLWGCCPLDLRLLEHAQLTRKLGLIAQLVKARIGIIDGTFGLDRHGPMEGNPRRMDVILAGDDLYALDWVVASMMGFNPKRIPHLQLIPPDLRESLAEHKIQSNARWEDVNWHFTLDLDAIDALSMYCFHSDLLSKIVFDSPLTRPIYAMLGRKPMKKLA